MYWIKQQQLQVIQQIIDQSSSKTYSWYRAPTTPFPHFVSFFLCNCSACVSKNMFPVRLFANKLAEKGTDCFYPPLLGNFLLFLPDLGSGQSRKMLTLHCRSNISCKIFSICYVVLCRNSTRLCQFIERLLADNAS